MSSVADDQPAGQNGHQGLGVAGWDGRRGHGVPVRRKSPRGTSTINGATRRAQGCVHDPIVGAACEFVVARRRLVAQPGQRRRRPKRLALGASPRLGTDAAGPGQHALRDAQERGARAGEEGRELDRPGRRRRHDELGVAVAARVEDPAARRASRPCSSSGSESPMLNQAYSARCLPLNEALRGLPVRIRPGHTVVTKTGRRPARRVAPRRGPPARTCWPNTAAGAAR